MGLLYSGASLQGTSWRRVLCPLYSGASLQGTSWRRVLCPLYSGASLQGTSWGGIPCPLYSGGDRLGLSLIQWSLSTRDSLRTGPSSPNLKDSKHIWRLHRDLFLIESHSLIAFIQESKLNLVCELQKLLQVNGRKDIITHYT